MSSVDLPRRLKTMEKSDFGLLQEVVVFERVQLCLGKCQGV